MKNQRDIITYNCELCGNIAVCSVAHLKNDMSLCCNICGGETIVTLTPTLNQIPEEDTSVTKNDIRELIRAITLLTESLNTINNPHSTNHEQPQNDSKQLTSAIEFLKAHTNDNSIITKIKRAVHDKIMDDTMADLKLVSWGKIPIRNFGPVAYLKLRNILTVLPEFKDSNQPDLDDEMIKKWYGQLS